VELSCSCQLPYENEPHKYTYDLQFGVSAAARGSQRDELELRVLAEKLLLSGPGFNDVALLTNNGREVTMLHEEDFVRGKQRGTQPTTLSPRDGTMLSKLYELGTNRRAIAFRDYLSSWLVYTLDPVIIRHGWRTSKFAPDNLRLHGDNLAVVLFYLKNMETRRFVRLLDHVRLVEPELEDISFVPSPGQAPVPFVVLRSQPKASWDGLSDGTLRFLALAAIVEAGGAPHGRLPDGWSPLVVIEEPENGVFPGHLRALFNLIDERAGDRQFVVTSHSPYFINFFDAFRESVTVLRRRNERTEVVPVPPPDEKDPDRPLLAEQYSMELFD